MNSNVKAYCATADDYIAQLHRGMTDTKGLPLSIENRGCVTHHFAELYLETYQALKKPLPDYELLDVCIGDGTSSRLFLRSGFNVHGIDGAPPLIETCHQNPQFQNSDLRFKAANLKIHDISDGELPYDDNSFSIVICSKALFCLKENIHAVSEIMRVTKPNGIAFIDTIMHEEDRTSVFQARLAGGRSNLISHIMPKALFDNFNNATLLSPTKKKKPCAKTFTDGRKIPYQHLPYMIHKK